LPGAAGTRDLRKTRDEYEQRECRGGCLHHCLSLAWQMRRDLIGRVATQSVKTGSSVRRCCFEMPAYGPLRRPTATQNSQAGASRPQRRGTQKTTARDAGGEPSLGEGEPPRDALARPRPCVSSRAASFVIPSAAQRGIFSKVIVARIATCHQRRSLPSSLRSSG